MPPPIVPGIPMRNSRPVIPYFDASLDIVMSNAPHSAYKLKSNGFIKLKLYKGNITIESRITNSKAYSMKKVSFEENKSFNKSNVERFINFHKKKLRN